MLDELVMELQDAPAVARLVGVVAIEAVLLIQARVLPDVLQVDYRFGNVGPFDGTICWRVVETSSELRLES